MATRTAWLSWLVFLGGLWLIIAPFLLGYTSIGSAMTNDITVGVLVAVAAFITAVWDRATASWLSWVIAIFGIWEVAAPFILGYSDSTSAAWNAIILGIIILIFAGARGLSLQMPVARREYGPTFFSEERPRKNS